MLCSTEKMQAALSLRIEDRNETRVAVSGILMHSFFEHILKSGKERIDGSFKLQKVYSISISI